MHARINTYTCARTQGRTQNGARNVRARRRTHTRARLRHTHTQHTHTHTQRTHAHARYRVHPKAAQRTYRVRRVGQCFTRIRGAATFVSRATGGCGRRILVNLHPVITRCTITPRQRSSDPITHWLYAQLAEEGLCERRTVVNGAFLHHLLVLVMLG